MEFIEIIRKIVFCEYPSNFKIIHLLIESDNSEIQEIREIRKHIWIKNYLKEKEFKLQIKKVY